MDLSACVNVGAGRPPTDMPTCAVAVAGNLTAVLDLCCQGGPRATYSPYSGAPDYCFQYCNITQPGLTYTMVDKCISDEWVKVNKTGFSAFEGSGACGPGKLPKTSAASKRVNHLKGVTSLVIWTLLGAAATSQCML